MATATPQVTATAPSAKESNRRSLRVGNVPEDASHDEFRKFMESLLLLDDDYVGGCILLSSLAPSCNGRGQVGTVCFDREPEVLERCRTGCEVYVTWHRGDRTYRLVVDCDFFGMTPLYHPQGVPEAEYVPRSLKPLMWLILPPALLR